MSIKFTNHTVKGNFEMECQTLNRTIEYDNVLSSKYHLVWVIKENNIEKYEHEAQKLRSISLLKITYPEKRKKAEKLMNDFIKEALAEK